MSLSVRRSGWVALQVLCLVASSASTSPVHAQADSAGRLPHRFDSTTLRQVDSIAAAEFAKDSLGSIAVGVVSGRDLVWSASYGFLDRTRRQRATPTAVYRIASVTKQITTIMLLQLREKRVIKLGDPVDRYFPEIRRVKGADDVTMPTLLQLATMTGGLARDPNDGRRTQTGLSERWLQTLLVALPSTEFVSEPGTAYRYSNVGFSILGAALSRAAKEDYVGYVRAHILRPLGMASTDFALSADMRLRLATGVDYDVLYKDTLNYDDAAKDHREGLGLSVPSGGLYSTDADLAKLVALEIGFGPDSVLTLESAKLRDNVPIAAPSALSFGYGLGVQVARWADTTALGHSGNLSGYTSQVFYSVSRQYGVIVLRSAAGGEADAGRLAGRAFRKLRADFATRDTKN
jgi:CubicO group peptidase (beta-lactamase class C family)